VGDNSGHRRSYDKGAQIEDPARLQAPVENKRAARSHRGFDRLARAAAASQTLLLRPQSVATTLEPSPTSLEPPLPPCCDFWSANGAPELEASMVDVLQRGVPHPNAVRLALERRRERRKQAPPVAIDLPAHVKPATLPSSLIRSTPMTSSRIK
jgi:hypothetical protein